MSETLNKVKQIVADKLGVSEEEVQATSNFINDLGADSLDLTELIMDLEKHFSLTIPDSDAEKISTVQAAVDYIDSKQS
ncbi:acyl carrier protein [Bacteroidia bacterium]|nr:acyl carrier protein [Bacteroidia bacterium]